MTLVRPIHTFSVDIDGVPVTVSEHAILEDTDPVVQLFPDQFRAVTATASTAPVRATEPEQERPVEQATAAPGERRNTRR